MNIEEIEIVKDFCNIKILYGRELCLLEEQLISYQKAIKALLTAYEKEKEKNKRLEKFIENGEYTWKQKYNETFDYVKSEFISKYKIKAKIEELIKEGNYRTANNPTGRVHFQKEITDYQIEVLQSLLEKE